MVVVTNVLEEEEEEEEYRTKIWLEIDGYVSVIVVYMAVRTAVSSSSTQISDGWGHEILSGSVLQDNLLSWYSAEKRLMSSNVFTF